MTLCKKEWSIYIYLNGNNELEPEMYRSMQDLLKAKVDKDINVVVQFAREDRKVAQIMRPNDTFNNNEEKWTGVRRIYVDGDNSRVIQELGKVNMADYKTLKKFLHWGMQNYPAKRNMVIIAGHGFMVASLSDLTGAEPKTMGLCEMCTAINSINYEIGEKIDVLVLDICYMNNIELVYELGSNKEDTVKNIITFIESGPIEGLQYSNLISYLSDNKKLEGNRDISKGIVNLLNENLLAIEMNSIKLAELKDIYNNMGNILLKRYKNYKKDEKDVIEDGEIKKYSENIEKIVNEIVFSYNNKTKGERKLLNIFDKDVYNLENKEAFLEYYNKLKFSKNNYWTNYVANNSAEDKLKTDISQLKDYTLTKDNIYAFIKIFNLTSSINDIEKIIEELYMYKNWS